MAEISDNFPADTDVKRLRLIVRWQAIFTDAAIVEELLGTYSIGLFMGEVPLFNALAYEGRAKVSRQQAPGFFYGESDGCEILRDLQRAATTNETVVIEDFVEPWTKIVIGRDIFGQSRQSGAADTALTEHVEILAVIQHGGPWEDGAMGYSGPAALMIVARSDLIAFVRDLFTEALDPSVSNEASLVRLREVFGDSYAIEHPNR